MNLFRRGSEYYFCKGRFIYKGAYPLGIDNLIRIETPKRENFIVEFPGFQEYCLEIRDLIWLYLFGSKEEKLGIKWIEDWKEEIEITKRLFPLKKEYFGIRKILFTDLVEKLEEVARKQICDTTTLHISYSLDELVEEIEKIEKVHLKPRMLYLQYSLNYPHLIKLRKELERYTQENRNQDADSLLASLDPKTYGLIDLLDFLYRDNENENSGSLFKEIKDKPKKGDENEKGKKVV